LGSRADGSADFKNRQYKVVAAASLTETRCLNSGTCRWYHHVRREVRRERKNSLVNTGFPWFGAVSFRACYERREILIFYRVDVRVLRLAANASKHDAEPLSGIGLPRLKLALLPCAL